MGEAGPLYTPPEYGEWLDVGGDVAITRPARFIHDGEEMLGSWIAHRRRDGENCGLGRIVFGGQHHQLVSEDPLHIEPSILCSGDVQVCGRHGWIRDGRWQDAGTGYG